MKHILKHTIQIELFNYVTGPGGESFFPPFLILLVSSSSLICNDWDCCHTTHHKSKSCTPLLQIQNKAAYYKPMKWVQPFYRPCT